MRTIKLCALLGIALLFAFAAMAQESTTITWAAPTQFVDNTNIPAGALDEFLVRCTALGLTNVETRTAGSARQAIFTLPPGNWSCTVQARVGTEWSGLSNAATRLVAARKVPKPATAVAFN